MEARILKMDVPEILMQKALKQVIKGTRKKKARASQWARKFRQHFKEAQGASKWKKAVEGATAAEFRASMAPPVKADKTKAEKDAKLSKAQKRAASEMGMGVKFAVSARKRFRKGAPEPPPAPAPEVPAADAPEHPWLGQVVRVTSDNAREQWIGLTGTVTSVRQMPDKTFSLQILSDGDSDGKGIQVIGPLPIAWVQQGRGDTKSVAPERLSYQQFTGAMRQPVRWRLLGADAPENLENIRHGQLVEQTSVAAMVEEVMARVQYPDAKAIMPTVATTLSFAGEMNEDQQLQHLQLQAEMDNFLSVGVFVWAQDPRHYTLLLAQRPQLQTPEGAMHPWHLRFLDPLQPPAATSHAAAQLIARRLGLLAADQQLQPPQNRRFQADGWSCGVWVARFWEDHLRERRGEPRTPVMPIARCIARANEFSEKIRKAKGGAIADPDAPKLAPGPAEHSSLEAAMEAAQACGKCRPRKDGQKGCSACMGEWFAFLRSRGGPR